MKGVGILTVIITHTGFLPFSRITSALVGGWVLLIFPYLGGYLFRPQSIFLFLKSKIYLLAVYFIAAVVSFMAWLFLRNVYPQNLLQSSITQEMWHFLLGKSLVFNGPLWFIPAYALSSLTVLFIYPLWQKGRETLRTFILIFFVISAFFLLSLKIVFPFSLDIVLLFVVFFFLGIRIREKSPQISLTHITVLSIVFFASSFLNGTVDLYERKLGIYPLFLICAFSGIFLIQLLVMRLNARKSVSRFFAYCGRHSLLLLVAHWPVIQWTSYALTLMGWPKLIGANPTITSFWLPHSGEPVIRAYVFGFLFLYLASVFIFSFSFRLTYCKLFAIIKPWIYKIN